jgi:nitronate monooxygenase
MSERPRPTSPSLVIRGHALLPIVQGGMGVGISAHRLAGAVAREGAVGTISSVDLRRHHPDLMERTRHCRDRVAIDAANLEALDREITAARALAQGHGLIAVNVMRAVSSYADYVRQACASARRRSSSVPGCRSICRSRRASIPISR